MKIAPSILASLTAAALLLGCSSDSHAPSQDPDSVAWPTSTGQELPRIALQGLDGEAFELASLRGKVLLIEAVGMT